MCESQPTATRTVGKARLAQMSELSAEAFDLGLGAYWSRSDVCRRKNIEHLPQTLMGAHWARSRDDVICLQEPDAAEESSSRYIRYDLSEIVYAPGHVRTRRGRRSATAEISRSVASHFEMDAS